MPARVARGLAAFLNSSVVDLFFRQFSGHTQVNATDLRSLTYPTTGQLESLGSTIGDAFPPDQHDLDEIVYREIFAPDVSEDQLQHRKIAEVGAMSQDLAERKSEANAPRIAEIAAQQSKSLRKSVQLLSEATGILAARSECGR